MFALVPVLPVWIAGSSGRLFRDRKAHVSGVKLRVGEQQGSTGGRVEKSFSVMILSDPMLGNSPFPAVRSGYVSGNVYRLSVGDLHAFEHLGTNQTAGFLMARTMECRSPSPEN
jgi:hypothetical protein